MNALVWIVEDTWEATVAAAAELLPEDAQITLLHVVPAGVEDVAGAARTGLLGRRPPPPPGPAEPLQVISQEAAAAVLANARAALGRPAETLGLRGHVEHEVVRAAERMDIVVLARDGDHSHAGPRSLGPAARFVVDHASCRVLLIWPDTAPHG